MVEVIRVGGVAVAERRSGAELPAHLSPRPHLHPIRTLGGRVVTDTCPDDHPWHLGFSFALQDVDGWNFWGGNTYVRDQGYVAREDHGRIETTALTRSDAGFDESLTWRTPHEPLLRETRNTRASRTGPGWQLHVGTTLTNATARTLSLGSPATNGRAGAGYGGFFWRLPAAVEPEVFTDAATGEDAVHGSSAPWLTWTDRDFTLVFANAADPWFARLDDYPGIGLQLAATDPVLLDPGASLTRDLHVLIADGTLNQSQINAWKNS
ncbi:PmoA family protein [Saccharopolyspora sp. TS4A08]|uniref:PmoA family protein n=1 Tax=Saccharopolyspora ipomoeae TaxID=3042027 RepID=A0ABT6PGN1_9PSEU|nr:PmoA family protein [Saccharopolyspora sp. TS4A08]MDI2027167.1 PmoA family protein [Saccharopolyspora sp. TS4A08]